MLYPGDELAHMLQNHPEREAEVFDLLGRLPDYELRGEGRVYGGGLNKIEPRELVRISASDFIECWPGLRDAARRRKAAFDEARMSSSS